MKWTAVALFVLIWGLAVPGNAQQEHLLGPPAIPTVVSIGFLLLDLNSINEREETFEFEAIVTLRWNDPRHAFDPVQAGVERKQFQGSFQFNETYTGWWPLIIVGNGAETTQVDVELLWIESDGSMTYIEKLHIEAEEPMDLRAFPFDQQSLRLYLQVLGHDSGEVQLVLDPNTNGISTQAMNIAGWTIEGVHSEISEAEIHPGYRISQFAGLLNVSREPFHLIALVVVPLTLLVTLTWSVFWMDKESVSDRINISFIGVLAVVAYQFVVQDAMPAISYFTLMDAFLISTLAIVGLGVAVNLIVDKLNQANRRELGDRVDYTCRWAFPLGFVVVNGIFALLLV
jgi:hypothetical protein